MTAPSPKLSNMQLELLKLFSKNLPEEQLVEIKGILRNYFIEKAIKEADRVWEEKGWTNELMDEWLNDENQ